MLATFIIEIVLAVHTLVKYRLSKVKVIATGLLLCLATFQLAEYNVCEGALGISSTDWARLGYVAITLLPPLGIHLCSALANDTRKWLPAGAYAAGVLFSGYFLWETTGAGSGVCLGNYVIYNHGATLTYWYAAYYFSLLLVAIGYALTLAVGAKTHIKQALYALVVGYAAFIIPTTVVNIVAPVTIAGIPSIMCGFAVLLAITLAGRVLPEYNATKAAHARTTAAVRT